MKFKFGKDEVGNDLLKNYIGHEYSYGCKLDDEPYYLVNDEKNSAFYLVYKNLAGRESAMLYLESDLVNTNIMIYNVIKPALKLFREKNS